MKKHQFKPLLKKITNFPYFLILIGLFPILNLINSNLGQISITDIGPSAMIAMIASMLISTFCLLAVHPISRAYYVAVLFNVAFFTYGHLFNLIDAKTVNGFLIGRHMLFFPLFSFVVAALFVFIMKQSMPHVSNVLKFTNIMILGPCLVQIVGICVYGFSISSVKIPDDQLSEQKTISSNESGPDIYYIIIDGLAREDVIREQFGEVEYTLPEELQKRGFYIPKCAFSNYGGTAVSLSSSLNINYLHNLGIMDEQVNTKEDDPAVLYNLLHGNLVARQLERKGYQFVAFRGFFPLNDFRQADYYYSFSSDKQGFDVLAERSFREMFIRTTLLRLLSEWFEGSPQKFTFVPKFFAELIAPEASSFSSRSYQWYQEHLYTFDKLQTIPLLPEKKFVYAHFYTTHQPYVFNQDGSLLWPIDEHNNGYLYAMQYTSTRILEVIDRILEDSEQPPVIVIQADHGIGSEMDRYKIMNAYYLPGGNQGLYETITPVNTFRLILNQYIGEQYELVPDIIMYSQIGEKDFIPIASSCEMNK